jgi:hypothetical protein
MRNVSQQVKSGKESTQTAFIKKFRPTATLVEKLLRKWPEDFNYILELSVSGIIARLSEKMEVRDEFE